MKKQLLLGAFIISSFFCANAQYSTSFESSEGFTLGQLGTQNGWGVSQIANQATVTISDAYASEGSYSLSVAGENGTNHSLRGAFSPTFVVSGDIITFSFDIMTSAFSDNGSDFLISPQSPTQELISSRVLFRFDGAISVLDEVDGAPLNYVVTEATYEAETWYNVAIVQNNTNGTLDYYLDGELIYSGVAFGATNIEQITILNDNYEGQAWIDNIQVVEGLLSVKSPIASQFSIYPNPATDVINITNADNILVNNVAVVDLNGRTVKSLNFNNVSEAQINIGDLASGMYLLNVSSDKGTMTKKIVKN